MSLIFKAIKETNFNPLIIDICFILNKHLSIYPTQIVPI